MPPAVVAERFNCAIVPVIGAELILRLKNGCHPVATVIKA